MVVLCCVMICIRTYVGRNLGTVFRRGLAATFWENGRLDIVKKKNIHYSKCPEFQLGCSVYPNVRALARSCEHGHVWRSSHLNFERFLHQKLVRKTATKGRNLRSQDPAENVHLWNPNPGEATLLWPQPQTRFGIQNTQVLHLPSAPQMNMDEHKK